IMAVAMGTFGLQLADISVVTAPALRGTLAGGSVQNVLVRGKAVLLADTQRSFSSVDASNLDSPTLTAFLGSAVGVPVDIAAYGSIAITADQSFGKATPIISIADPLHPVAFGSSYWWQWQSDPGLGTGIAMDIM
ncbi:MAG: hypothetical protein JO185_09820, partial [Acidobacteriaceae bacterium]|nr:hypothetical protein [Acidobacteriaceae bacterium]